MAMAQGLALACSEIRRLQAPECMAGRTKAGAPSRQYIHLRTMAGPQRADSQASA